MHLIGVRADLTAPLGLVGLGDRPVGGGCGCGRSAATGEGLAQIDASALRDHALGLLNYHPAGQGTRQLLVQALGLGRGTPLHDAESGQIGERPGRR